MMKRRNVQLAFVGEGTAEGNATDELVEQMVEGDEAIDIVVTGGKLMLVVPAGTPDEQIFTGATMLGGELVLENGLHLSFEILGDAVGAQFAASEESEQQEPHQGLSSLPDVPGGV
jgi:hypothetical protein